MTSESFKMAPEESTPAADRQRRPDAHGPAGPSAAALRAWRGMLAAMTPDRTDEPAPIGMAALLAQHAPLRPALEAAFRRVLDSGCFILGPEVAAFEREAAAALGVPHAV